VALFLLVFYRVLGVTPSAHWRSTALYFYALIKLVPVTLTLPGIAGLSSRSASRRTQTS